MRNWGMRGDIQPFAALGSERLLLGHELGKDMAGFLFRSEERPARVRTISAFVEAQGIQAIDFLKIDVEGDEPAALQGIRKKHYPRIRGLALEAHTPELADEVCAVLSGAGFVVSREACLGSLPGIRGGVCGEAEVTQD